ncbi:methyl-accepting chemotaxis protein [Roseateles sp. BYS78W]|uniref:Methyl-accepting chemotaxis protein n=1 Tax=Pelomonas candidula TaxID=3299025 RepID=A0ABW7HC87_9BURK
MQVLLRAMRIGNRLGAAFGALLLSLCAVAAFGTWQMSKVNANVVDLDTNWLPSVEALGQMQQLASEVRRTALLAVVELDAGNKARAADQHQAAAQDFLAKARAYEAMISSPEEQQLYKDIRAGWDAFLAADTLVMQAANGGDAQFQAARELASGSSATLYARLKESIAKDVKLNRDGGAQAGRDAAASYQRALWVNISVAAAAVLAGLLLAMQVTISIVRPIAKAVATAREVADGNLTGTIDDNGHDEPAELLYAMAQMVQQLGALVSQVRDCSDSIATGSGEIASGSADLSQRTEQQAASLEETAASMEQMNATVRQNADAAQMAGQLADTASGVAARGGDMVRQVIATMGDISASSKKIADIIGTIDGIAFQTNILALNAAVEAARAGEQGRGFAVVAGEVRTLAQRSAQAAREIKALIGQSVDNVAEGARMVDNTGETMTEIVVQFKRVADLIGEIGSATKEQSSGISQVSGAVAQLDQVTQQNAALVEESAAAAESLRSRAQQLETVVGRFKVARSAR